MRSLRFVVLALAVGLQLDGVVQGQTTSYRPFGSWVDPEIESLNRWNLQLQNLSERVTPTRSDSRPQLAGLRPKSVELLADGLLRKHRRLLAGNPAKARKLLLRRYQKNPDPLRGYMAEAIFVDRNPEWGYVASPNATQHDVYRRVPGQGPPRNAQVKYHDSGKPSLYAGDMVKDHRAHEFLIPDDHVEATRAYLRSRAERLNASGDLVGAQRAWRDRGRVRPIGATSSEIRSATTEAARHVIREKYATYTSLGASLVLSLPTLYGWVRGDLSANIAASRAARSLSLIGMGVGADFLLKRISQGARRGTVRGNIIVGTAITITEAAWLLHEHGWHRAFYRPEFYEQSIGGVSGLALAVAGFTVATGLAVETGPWAPVIGTGVSILTGAMGYVGGSSATRALIELLAPEMLTVQEKQRLQFIKSGLDRLIAQLQAIRKQ
jgi:hypothetical protein